MTIERDDFLGGRLKIAQPRHGYRAGSDAVLLASAVPARPGEHILEAGTGVGVSGLCLLARVEDVRVTGVEIQPEFAELTRQNAETNGFSARFSVIEADLAARGSVLQSKGLVHESYDHSFANPPYFEAGKARASANKSKALAHVGPDRGGAIWIRFLCAMTRPKGTVTLIHRAQALDMILESFRGRAGDIRVKPVASYDGQAADRVLVRAVKTSRAPMQLLAPLVMHRDDKGFSPAAEAILRRGAALSDFCPDFSG